MNLFAYCCCNPINMVDYYGNEAMVLAAIICVSLVGIALVGLVAIDSSSLQNVFYSIASSISNAIDELINGLSNKNRSTQSNSSAAKGVSTPDNPIPPNNNNNRKNDGTPKDNRKQNKQVDDICRKYGLDKDQRRMLHNEISHQNYGYHEIEEIAKSIILLQ